MPDLSAPSTVGLPQNQSVPQGELSLFSFKRKRLFVFIVILVLLIIAIGGYFYLQTLPSFKYREEIKSIDSLIVNVQSLTPEQVSQVYPGHTEVQDQGVTVAKDNTLGPLRKASEAFTEGDIEEGRKYLLEVADLIDGFAFVGDSKEGVWMPQELKQKHDPLGEYIPKSDAVSKVWLESMYLPIIDLLVSTDKEYKK